MNTPLQQAAQDLIARWLSPSYIAGDVEALRTALDDELTQSFQPVAYRSKLESGSYVYCLTDQFFDTAEPVYLHPPRPQAASPAVPEGYVLVPIEPTEAMVDAYLAANTAYWLRTDELPNTDPSRWRQGTPSDATAESYRAMINAAQGEKP